MLKSPKYAVQEWRFIGNYEKHPITHKIGTFFDYGYENSLKIGQSKSIDIVK